MDKKEAFKISEEWRRLYLEPKFYYEYKPAEDITLHEIALLLPAFNMNLPSFERYIEKHNITRHFEKVANDEN